MKYKPLLLTACLLILALATTTSVAAQQVEMVYHDSDVIHVLAITNAALMLDVEQVTYEYISYAEFNLDDTSDILVLFGEGTATILIPEDATNDQEEIAVLIAEAASDRVTPKIKKVSTIDLDLINEILKDYGDELVEGEEEREDEEFSKTIEVDTEPKVCDGCQVEDACYPAGTVIDNKYCDGKNLVAKKADTENCQSDVECQSNICIQGLCTTPEEIEEEEQIEIEKEDEGFFTKFWNWFTSIFS